jgi:predicted ATPase
MPHRIEVRGFKSIDHLRLDLRPLSVLVGSNGAGKSNLIQALGLVAEIMKGQLQVAVGKAGGASRLLRHGPKVTPSMTLSFHEEASAYTVVLGYSQDDTLIIEKETCLFPAGDWVVGAGYRESPIPFRDASLAPPAFVDFRTITSALAWEVYHFQDTSRTAPVKRKGPIDDNERLRPDASNLAALLYRLQQTDQNTYLRIRATVRLVAPFFRDFSLKPDRLAPESMQLEWLEVGSDAYMNASALSDGTLRFICLATLLLQPTLPSLVLVDEPELGLHPHAVHLLADLLKAASTRTSILVATQSVTLLNQLDPGDVVVVDRGEDGRSTFRRLDPEDLVAWSDDYALGELWEKNVFALKDGHGGNPRRS